MEQGAAMTITLKTTFVAPKPNSTRPIVPGQDAGYQMHLFIMHSLLVSSFASSTADGIAHSLTTSFACGPSSACAFPPRVTVSLSSFSVPGETTMWRSPV